MESRQNIDLILVATKANYHFAMYHSQFMTSKFKENKGGVKAEPTKKKKCSNFYCLIYYVCFGKK